MRVYVVRHGESETNRDQKWTGWFDAPLTDKGRADAQKAAEFLKDISFDKIYSSDLSRAVETAKIAVPNCAVETSLLLREIDVGSLANEGNSHLTSEQRYQIAENGFADFGGETRAQIRERVKDALKLFENLDCETIGVFTHAGWMTTMLDVVLGVDIPKGHVKCKNCTIAIYEYKGTKWLLDSWVNL